MPEQTDGPLPSKLAEEVEEKTGDIAMTTPGRCYDCNDRVGGEPDFIFSFADLDAALSVWVCQTCYDSLLEHDEGWNNAANNV